jgi:signal transduction histidine kinase
LHISEKLASVGRLSATIAHEINNPLEAITNFIYLALQEPTLPAKIQEYLKAADQELARVAHVAQQTLGFYRDNTNPSLVDVSSAVQQVLKVYENRLHYKGIEVEQRIPPHTMVQTLAGQLKQIMLNLVANAIDASRENGGKLVVSAWLSTHVLPGTDLLVLTIADNGSGISKSDQTKIFEPFFTTKKDVGTGLGLWITCDLVEKKGGSIRVRSRTGAGTVFSVFLPVAFERSIQKPAA